MHSEVGLFVAGKPEAMHADRPVDRRLGNGAGLVRLAEGLHRAALQGKNRGRTRHFGSRFLHAGQPVASQPGVHGE